jgi:hypothetical protein
MKIANHPRGAVTATSLGLLSIGIWGVWRALVLIATATELPTGVSHFWNWYGQPTLDALNASCPSVWLLAGLGIIITSVVLDRFWERIPFRITLKNPMPLRETTAGQEPNQLVGSIEVARPSRVLPASGVVPSTAGPTAELEIAFDKVLNYTVHESGLAEARLWVWNRSKAVKAKNLHVKVESLQALTNKRKAQRYAMSFTNFDLHLERSSPGATLDADSHVEVFVLKHPKGDPMLYFISAENGSIYRTPAASYVLTIRATSDNCPAIRQAFKIGLSKGVMTFKKCDPIQRQGAARSSESVR